MGAIIYDDKYEALIIMSKPADHDSPDIPAVFISQKSGLVLKRLMTPGVSLVTITPVRAQALPARQRPLLMLSSLLLLLAQQLVRHPPGPRTASVSCG